MSAIRVASAARLSQIEEATHCRFAASEHALAGSPLLSEAVWTMDSDESIDLKQTYFLPDDPENTVKGERRSSRRMTRRVSWARIDQISYASPPSWAHTTWATGWARVTSLSFDGP